MRFNRNTIATLLMTAVMVMAVVTGGAAAALTYDDETTNTTTTSDWTGGETVTDLDNESKQARLEVTSDNASSGDNLVVKAVVNDSDSDQDGETFYEDSSSWDVTDETNGHYERNVTYATVFSELERDAGETVTVDIVTVYNESESDEEEGTIQIDAKNGANPLLVAGDNAELQELGGGFFSLSTLSFGLLGDDSDTTPEAARLEKTVNVSDNTTELTVAQNNENVSDALDAATENTDSGALTTDAYVLMDETPIPVFDQSADVEWLDTESQTYAVADGDGITVNNVNETLSDDANSTDVVVVANGGLGFWDTRSMVSDYGASFTGAASAAIDAGWGSTFEESALEG